MAPSRTLHFLYREEYELALGCSDFVRKLTDLPEDEDRRAWREFMEMVLASPNGPPDAPEGMSTPMHAVYLLFEAAVQLKDSDSIKPEWFDSWFADVVSIVRTVGFDDLVSGL